VDATTGYHLWAERYDREVKDIFAVQDEVTQQIVRAMAVKLTAPEKVRLGRAPTGVLEAYDLVLRGQEERQRTTPEGNAEARRLFAKALDLDPGYAAAYLGLSWTHLQSWQLLWSADRENLERARELAEQAIALDDTLVGGYAVLGQIYLWMRDYDRAIAQAERAIAIAPNDADGYETYAEILGWSGRPQDSIRMIRQAMRLNPHYPFFYLWTLGHGYYLTEQRQQALDAFAKVIQENPNFVAAHAYRAVVLTELGRASEAREAWQKARELSSGVSMLNIRERLPYRRPADVDRLLTAMHRAGLH
jgi:tetratricopeptide (TPR) repeat protein